MGQAANRNAPCPCGSGKKLKNCCIDKPPPAQRAKQAVLPVLLVAAGLGLGVFFGLTKSWTVGLTTGLGGLILAVLVIVVRDPPPPGGSGDSAGINFGA